MVEVDVLGMKFHALLKESGKGVAGDQSHRRILLFDMALIAPRRNRN